MNASTWNQVVISDETEELVKASIVPSTVETYRLAMQQLEIWLDGRSMSDKPTRGLYHGVVSKRKVAIDHQ